MLFRSEDYYDWGIPLEEKNDYNNHNDKTDYNDILKTPNVLKLEDQKTPETASTFLKTSIDFYKPQIEFESKVNNFAKTERNFSLRSDTSNIDYELTQILNAQIKIFADLEFTKAKLWFRHDFNYMNLYNYFASVDKDSINSYELQKGISELYIVCNFEDIHNLMKQYDKNMDGGLDIMEFKTMFKPIGHINTIDRSNSIKMSEKTTELLKECLKMLYETEAVTNYLKKIVIDKTTDGKFSIIDAFHRLDHTHKG